MLCSGAAGRQLQHSGGVARWCVVHCSGPAGSAMGHPPLLRHKLWTIPAARNSSPAVSVLRLASYHMWTAPLLAC